MTRDAGGLLVYFDERQRQSLIRDGIEGSYEPFSDALSVRDWKIGEVSIALLGFSEATIDYMALAKRGKRVATSKVRVEFYEIMGLRSVAVESIEARLAERIKPHFIRSSRGIGGSVPPKTWLALIDAIKQERPDLSEDIDRLMSLRVFSGYRLTGHTAEILLQQREALGAALDIFGGNNKLREKVLSAWAPHKDDISTANEDDFTGQLRGRSSFLEGIPQRYLQEESALQHDLFNWQGMTPIHEAGTSVFKQGDRRLEVIYANKNSLEHTLGVDLVYYNADFDLFVLVQYKLMHEESDRMVYRPDVQLLEELIRMDRLYELYRRTAPIQSHGEFRLTDDGFMIKLIPNQGLRPASGELIKGMYLLREYVHFLIGPKGPKGPKGGPLITFDGAPRYLTNSDFSASVSSGWIGTSGIQSGMLREVVRQHYETGNAMLVAYELPDEESASWTPTGGPQSSIRCSGRW